jgi:tetratricopeptide (TPR) repeat protein
MHRSTTARRAEAGALVALLCHALAGPMAWAASDPPRLALAPLGTSDGVPDKAGTKFGQLLADEMKTREDDLRWVALPRSTSSTPSSSGAARKTPSPEAVEALAQGGKFMDDQQFDDAVAAFKKGIDLELADPGSADFKELDYALVRLAAGYFRLGEEKKAQTALFQVARLSPDYPLPEGQFPPVFKREFEKAQHRVEKAARGTVSVDGPSGSTVFLNGRDLGMVPVQQEDVPAGTQYVRVEGPRGERFGQAVEVRSGTVKVRAGFGGSAAGGVAAAAAELHVGATLDSEMATKAARLCKLLDVDFLVVAHLSHTGDRKVSVGAALYSARKQGFAKLPKYDVDEDVLTGNVEAFHLTDDVVARMKAFDSPDALPLSLGSETARVTVVVPKKTSTPSDVPTRTDTGKPDGTGDGTKVRALEHRSELVDSQPSDGTTAADTDTHRSVFKGVPWWVYVAAGVVVVGAATGGIYAYTQASKPVSGTANVSW